MTSAELGRSARSGFWFYAAWVVVPWAVSGVLLWWVWR